MDTPPPLRAQLELSFYQVEIGTYSSLNIQEMVSPHWVVSHVLMGHVRARTRGEETWVSGGDVMVHPPHVSFSELADGPGGMNISCST